jgi:phosphatidylglycerol:prolipoprotein diacylglycerol transferase
MFPHVLELPLPFGREPFHLRSFGLMVAIGFLVGAHLLQRLVRRYGDDPAGDPERFSRVTIWLLVGVLAGARLAYVLVEVLRGSADGREFLARPWTALFIWQGGLVMYGGLFGAVALGVWSGRREHLRIPHGLDMGLVAGFVGLAIGRVGCLLVGDDYGAPVPEAYAGLPFPITLRVPDPLPEGSLFGDENRGLLLWATQPWMSLNALFLAWIGWRLLKRRRYAGQVSLWLLLLYSITRFCIESFRGDSARGLWLGGRLSTSQIVSVVCALVAIALLVRFRGRRDPLPDALRPAGEAG